MPLLPSALPPKGEARRYVANDFLNLIALPDGEGKEEAASPQKRKPTPPRCARQPLPREGARVDTHSFLWKEVPQRGGGWMEGSGMKESEGDRLKYAVCESTLSTAARSPFPNGEGYETGKAVSSTQSLPRVGKVASGASRIGFWRDEKEGGSSQVDDSRKHPLQNSL